MILEIVEIRRFKDAGVFCSTPGCGTTAHSIQRAATARLYLLGHPVGAYCKTCTALWVAEFAPEAAA